jgi:DNA-binding CsgD family transcriptional regulator
MSQSHRALYSLLMSQALDKKDIKVKSDSLITIATNYYKGTDPVHAGYAWFYRSRTASYRGSVNEQANNLLKAQEYSEKTQNYKLIGLVYSEKGLMYKTQQQYDSSIYYFKHAYRTFEKIPDYRSSILSLLNIGENFLYISKNDSALNYYNLAEKLSKLSNDKLLQSSVYRSLGSVYNRLKNYSLSLYYYKQVPLTHTTIYDSNNYYLIAKTYIEIDRLDSARIYLNKVNELKSMAPDYYQLWQTYYKKEGNLTKALYYANQVNSATDSLYKNKLNISFAGMEKKYKFQGLQIMNQNLIIKNKQRGLFLLFTLFILSIFVVIVLFWRLNVKRNQLLANEQLLAKEIILKEIEKEKFEKEKENSALLEKQLKLHAIILLNIEQHRNNSIKRPTSKENSPQQNATFYEELIASMDLEYNDITNRLLKAFPSLTELNIIICCLILAGFDTGMIATILDVQIESIIKHRYRLRTKFGLQNSEHLVNFLRQF